MTKEEYLNHVKENELRNREPNIYDLEDAYMEGYNHAVNMAAEYIEEDALVEELGYDDYIRFFNEHPGYNNDSWGFDEAWKFAKYFYKLGLKAKL